MELPFYQRAGVMALGSRLRHLSERLTQDSLATYQLAGITFEPRWFPVYFMLLHQPRYSVGQLAEEIGQTHASVSQIAKQLEKAGLLEFASDEQDGRVRFLQLSEAGQALQPDLEQLCADVHQAVVELLSETSTNFWRGIQELEQALNEQSLIDRVRTTRANRCRSQLKIVLYESTYQQAFHDLNREWIEQYFTYEAADRKALEHPDTYILDPGGQIFIALDGGAPIGTVALIRMENGDFELAKMAVSPRAQGKGVGRMLGEFAIQYAREQGVQRLYLETNTALQPAIRLYHRLGFQQLHERLPSPYARSNYQMELCL